MQQGIAQRSMVCPTKRRNVSRAFRRATRLIPTATCLIAMSVDVTSVHASCGQAFCPIESAAVTERPAKGNDLILDGSWEYIDQDQPRIGSHRARVGERPSPEHDEIDTVNRTYKLIAEYGLTDHVALGTVISGVHRDHRHVVREDEELESWDFSGLGDVQLWGRYLLLAPTDPPDRSFSIGAGVKLPTGSTGRKNDEDERGEITLQPGTGSTDALVSVAFVQPLNLWAPTRRVWAPMFISSTARFTGTDGRFGYRAGTDVFMNLGMSYPVVEQVHLLGQVNFRYRDRDDAGGAEGVPEENTGGEFLFLSPGLRVRVIRDIWAYGTVQLPVYQRVNGIQLTADWNLLLGVSARVSLPSLFTASDN